jgi:hypothetical protein
LATANNDFDESEYPIVSFAKVRDVEGDGDPKDIYSVALKTKHGITQSFVDDRAFNEAQRTYNDEYEIGLLAFACRKILEEKIRSTTFSENELKKALEGSLDTTTTTDNLKDLNQLSQFLKTPLKRESDKEVLEPEVWLEQKKELDKKVKEIAQKIDNDSSIDSKPLEVYNSGKRESEKKYFKNPTRNEETDQNAEADKAARKFSTHSASRIIGNRAEERIKLNAAEVDLSKEEAEEQAEKFLNKKYGGNNEKLIPKITDIKDGTLWGQKTVTRDRTDDEKKSWKDDFKTDYKLLLKQQIPDVASTNSSSVHRPRNRDDIATVLFDGEPANNRMFLSLKGTNKYVMAEQCKSESIINGKYFVKTFENGKPISKEFPESQIGKVIIPKNTIFTLNKKTGEYEPQNAMDLLKPNLPNPDNAQYEFGIYKDFKLKAISSVDGKRHMATLFQGEVEADFDLPRKISRGLNSDGKLGPIIFKEENVASTTPTNPSFDVNVGSIGFGDLKIDVFCQQTWKKDGGDLVLSDDRGKYFIKLEQTQKNIDWLKSLYPDPASINNLKDHTGCDIPLSSLTVETNKTLKIELNQDLFDKIKKHNGSEPSKTLDEYKKEFNKTIIKVEFNKGNSSSDLIKLLEQKTTVGVVTGLDNNITKQTPLGKYNNNKLNPSSSSSSGR